MSYSTVQGFGSDQPEDWMRVGTETDEVYLWSAYVAGEKLVTREQVRSLLRSVARAVVNPTGFFNHAMECRGLIIKDEPTEMCDGKAGTCYHITAVFTAGSVTASPASSDRVGDLITEDPSSGITYVSEPYWLQYTDSSEHPALAFWFDQPIVWDSQAGKSGMGGPTASWVAFKGLFKAGDELAILGDPDGDLVAIESEKVEPEDKPDGAPLPWLSILAGAGLLAGVYYLLKEDKR